MKKGVNCFMTVLSMHLKRPLKRSAGMISIFLIFLVMGVCFSGCLTSPSADGDTISEDPMETAEPTQASPSVKYYDFDDILVPNELNLQKNDSFVFQTPGFYGGVLTFTGSVERNSLIAFFENNMAKDNWQAVGSFKGIRSIMLFKKKNRWCVIKIEERSFDVLTEIWVAPTITDQVEKEADTPQEYQLVDPAGGLLKE